MQDIDEFDDMGLAVYRLLDAYEQARMRTARLRADDAACSEVDVAASYETLLEHLMSGIEDFVVELLHTDAGGVTFHVYLWDDDVATGTRRSTSG